MKKSVLTIFKVKGVVLLVALLTLLFLALEYLAQVPLPSVGWNG